MNNYKESSLITIWTPAIHDSCSMSAVVYQNSFHKRDPTLTIKTV